MDEELLERDKREPQKKELAFESSVKLETDKVVQIDIFDRAAVAAPWRLLCRASLSARILLARGRSIIGVFRSSCYTEQGALVSSASFLTTYVEDVTTPSCVSHVCCKLIHGKVD